MASRALLDYLGEVVMDTDRKLYLANLPQDIAEVQL